MQPILAPTSNSDPLMNEPVLVHFDPKVFKALGRMGSGNLPQGVLRHRAHFTTPRGSRGLIVTFLIFDLISAWKSTRTKRKPLTVKSTGEYATVSPKSSPVWKPDGGLFSLHIEPGI